jgi:Uncharacterized protein conserved in bacteria (DUF2188)
MAKKVLFVEQRPDHKYTVTEKGDPKPLAVTNTQAEAIQKAQRIAPDAALHVERVRDAGPGRDKWRKI